jgi:hypothetical protein
MHDASSNHAFAVRPDLADLHQDQQALAWLANLDRVDRTCMCMQRHNTTHTHTHTQHSNTTDDDYYVHNYKFIAGSGGLVSVHDLTSSTCKSDWLKSRDFGKNFTSLPRRHGVLKGGLSGCARVGKRGCTLFDGMGLGVW